MVVVTFTLAALTQSSSIEEISELWEIDIHMCECVGAVVGVNVEVGDDVVVVSVVVGTIAECVRELWASELTCSHSAW